MFIERDFKVKQEQINEQLRQRALERQIPPAKRPVPARPFRQVRQLIYRVMPAARRPVPAFDKGKR